MTGNETTEDDPCEDEAIDFVRIDPTVCRLYDDVLQRSSIVVKTEKPAAIVVIRWQRLGEEMGSEDFIVFLAQINMPKDHMLGDTCPP